MKITLFDTNTAILLAIAIIIDTQFLPITKKTATTTTTEKTTK